MPESNVVFRSPSFFSKAAADAEKPGRSWFNFRGEAPVVSDEEAFLTILIGAARADEVISPEEAQELSALALRTRTLSKLTLARIAELQKHIDDKINRDGLEPVLASACSSILGSSEQQEYIRVRAESVFAHAVDLARRLKLDPDRAKAIVALIEVKNSY